MRKICVFQPGDPLTKDISVHCIGEFRYPWRNRRNLKKGKATAFEKKTRPPFGQYASRWGLISSYLYRLEFWQTRNAQF